MLDARHCTAQVFLCFIHSCYVRFVYKSDAEMAKISRWDIDIMGNIRENSFPTKQIEEVIQIPIPVKAVYLPTFWTFNAKTKTVTN